MTDPARPVDPGSDTDPAPPRRLVAGALGPERRSLRLDRDEPRWYEPIHVRAPAAARDRAAAQVEAGADILVAPTWLTHRRALLPAGETRRAREWTEAAVRLAREAVEAGLERRERAAEKRGRETEEPQAPPFAHGPVSVAGVLPSLATQPEPGTGRLAPRDAAAERDLGSQAGILAEAGVDLVLVEGGPDIAAARLAVEAAAETGLPVWVATALAAGGAGTSAERGAIASGEPVEAWAEAMRQAGATTLLLLAAPGADPAEALARARAAGVPPEATGILATPTAAASDDDLATAATRWLDAGAWHLGLLDGATPTHLATLRGALDALEGARLAAVAARAERWTTRVRDAARRAPGGHAAWLGPPPADGRSLPAGFDWVTVPAAAAATLPRARFRLLVSPTPTADPAVLAALLEPGGYLLARDLDAAAVTAAGLRVAELEAATAATAAGTTVLARRDP